MLDTIPILQEQLRQLDERRDELQAMPLPTFYGAATFRNLALAKISVERSRVELLLKEALQRRRLNDVLSLELFVNGGPITNDGRHWR